MKKQVDFSSLRDLPPQLSELPGTPVVPVDVLVIGGGIAGAFAAYHAKMQLGASVAIVDKSFFGASGCSALASGTYPTYLSGDDKDKWVKNWCIPLTNERLFVKFLSTSEELLNIMDKWGVDWIKQDGEISRSQGPGKPFPTNAMINGGGPQLMMAVRRGVLGSGVKVFDRIMITDILTSAERGARTGRRRVVGAMGLNVRTAELLLFNSKAVIVCTGPYKFPYPHAGERLGGMPIDLCGDGIAAMLRIGADISKTELGGIWAMPNDFLTAPGFEMLLGLGAKLTNRLGQRFMESYDKERLERAHRVLLYAAIYREIEEGRGPVELGIMHFTPDQMRLVRSTIPIIIKNFEKAGYDLAKDAIPYTACPAGVDGVFSCGARINDRCETSIEGLFAAGGSSDVSYLHQGPAFLRSTTVH